MTQQTASPTFTKRSKRHRDPSSEDDAANSPARKPARRRRFEEGEATLEQAQRYHLLTARMPIQALTSEWSVGQNRPINEQHVEDLCKIFKQGALKRNAKENHILVLCIRDDVGNMLQHVDCEETIETTEKMPNFAEWLIVNDGRNVEILAG